MGVPNWCLIQLRLCCSIIWVVFSVSRLFVWQHGRFLSALSQQTAVLFMAVFIRANQINLESSAGTCMSVRPYIHATYCNYYTYINGKENCVQQIRPNPSAQPFRELLTLIQINQPQWNPWCPNDSPKKVKGVFCAESLSFSLLKLISEISGLS